MFHCGPSWLWLLWQQQLGLNHGVQVGLDDLASIEVVASFPRITPARAAVAGATAADTKDSVRPPGAFAVSQLPCTLSSEVLPTVAR